MAFISSGGSGSGASALASAQTLLTSGDITTTSTSFVDLTGVTLNITLTGARRVLVVFSASVANTVASTLNAFDIAIDGTRQGGTAGLMDTEPGNTSNTNASFSFLTAALSAAAHTIKIQWRVGSGTGTVRASAATPVVLSAVELAT